MKLAADISTLTQAVASTALGGTVGPNLGYTVSTDLSRYEQICVYASLSAVAAGGTLDVFLQQSPDDGLTWVDWLHFPQVAAGGTLIAVAPQFVNTSANYVAVGTNLTPALAAGAGVGSHPGDRLRLLYKTGAGWALSLNQTIKLYGVERMYNR